MTSDTTTAGTVFFALTRHGWLEIAPLLEGRRASIWVNHGVLDESEFLLLRQTGIDVSRFTSPIDPTDEEDLRRAVLIIAEHHPRQRMWLEVPLANLLESERTEALESGS